MFEYKAKVVRVVDGDTVDLCVDLGFRVQFTDRFRVHGIDAPETYGVSKDSEEYKKGTLAKEWLESQIRGSTVLVRTDRDKRGKFGRWLAEIFLTDGTNIGAEMIKLGYASEYKK